MWDPSFKHESSGVETKEKKGRKKDKHLGDLTTLVVSTEDGETVGIADLEGDEKRDGLNRIIATVNIVAHEKIVCVGEIASDLKELLEVVELAVDVSAHRNGRLDGLHV